MANGNGNDRRERFRALARLGLMFHPAGRLLLGSRQLGTALAFLGGRDEQEEFDQFREEQEQIAEEETARTESAFDRLVSDAERVSDQSLDASRRFFGSAQDRFRSFADPIVRGFSQLEQEGRSGADELVRLQEAREANLMAELEGLGEQERQDLQRSFRAARGSEAARLSSLGLSGTSAASGSLGLLMRERSDASGRLEERLRRERIGLGERLSGETLRQRAAGLEFGLDLGRQTLGAQTELGAAGLEFEEQSFRDLLSAEEHFGLLPATFGVERAEALARRRLHDIIRQPPPVGTFTPLVQSSSIDRLE